MEIREIQIEVLNWKKYNARNDIQNPWWFKFDNHFFDDPKLANYLDSEKLLWILILTMASREQKNVFTLKYSYIERCTSLEQCTVEGDNTLDDAIKKLVSDQCIRVHPVQIRTDKPEVLHRSGPRREKRREEKKREEKKRKENISSLKSHKFDFEGIYLKYPRKLGKQKGIEKCKAKILTPLAYQNLIKAVSNYSKYCEVQQTEEKYIKHFDTFMTSWKDWINPDPGLFTPKPPYVSKNLGHSFLDTIF